MTAGSAPTPISVLLPMYNGEAYLAEQVRSILDQEGVDVRLFIIDDCSHDGSLALADWLASEDKRITVLENSKNRGLIGTLDRLLSLVKTPYFSLSDQDDIWDPGKLRTSIDFLESNGHELVYSDVRIVDEAGREQTSSYLTSRKIRPIEGRDPVPFVFRNPAAGHTIVARREVAERARPMPSDLVFHEAWLVAAACSRGSVGFVSDGPLGSYRVHASNVVGLTDGGILQKALRILRNRANLTRRERIRAGAVRSLARVDPALSEVAACYAATGLKRLTYIPRHVRFLLIRNRQAGLRSVAVEAAAYAFGAFAARGTTEERRVGNGTANRSALSRFRC
ncbi:glycosyltransferase [Streptomyces sp900116325]|uniref:Glycosyltransferase n=1 Tax=Streptomyces sp. 900116325 TaxID=3154295 RepID=A0ABV2U786_9ACTN